MEDHVNVNDERSEFDTSKAYEDDATTATITTESSSTLTLPWSNVQDWALRDNLPKYLVRILTKSRSWSKEEGGTEPGKTAATTATTTLTTYCLWRGLLQDVPELAGYPVDFLQLKYSEQQKRQKHEDQDETTTSTSVVGILPYLQDYEFTAQGGVCGTVYGLEGVAEGSRIETSALIKVQETLPLGYVQTTEGIAFEVGRPMSKMLTGDDNRGWRILPNGASSAAAAAASGIQSATKSSAATQLATVGDVQGDDMLIRLGATTGILLAGATAINMLSHHMTVNVFWV